MSRDGSCPGYYNQPQPGGYSGQAPPAQPAGSPHPCHDQFAAFGKAPQQTPVHPHNEEAMLDYSGDYRRSDNRTTHVDRQKDFRNGIESRPRYQNQVQPRQSYSSEANWRGGQQQQPYSGEQGGRDQYETQVDTIFVQNLPRGCTREDVAEAFGSIGVVKIDKKTGAPKVWIYRDKQTGEGKGEATVTYDDPESANAAIRWFDQKQVLGQTVTVTLAFRRRNSGYQQRGRRGKGGQGYENRSDYYGRNCNDPSGPMRRHGTGRERNAPY